MTDGWGEDAGTDPWDEDDQPKKKKEAKAVKSKDKPVAKKKKEKDGWDEEEESPKPAKKAAGSKKKKDDDEETEKPKKKESGKKGSKKKKDPDWDDGDGEGEGDDGWGGGGGEGDGEGDDGWGEAGAGTDGPCEFCEGRGCGQCKGEEVETLEDKLSNASYEAEESEKESAPKSLELYRKVLEMVKGQTLDDKCQTIVFKAMLKIVVLYFKMKKESEAIGAYKELLAYLPNVSQTEGDEAIDTVLTDKYTEKKDTLRDQLYDITATTLQKLPEKGNMLFSIQMRQTQELVSKGRYKEAQKLLDIVHDRCRLPDGRDDQKHRGSELFDIYALELSLASKTKNLLKTKELYEKTKGLTTAVKNPKSQSIIRECWGKMFGNEGSWQKAYTEFYTAFTSYQEAGDASAAKTCLKYVVVANMLAKGEHNPFAAPEARVYQSDPDITPLINLRAAYDKRDVDAFSKCLDASFRSSDEFIQTHMTQTVEEFHRLAALKLLKSYSRIKISELATKLQIPEEKTEEVLIQLILDGRLGGKIDQVKGVLDLSQRAAGGDADRYNALEQWSNVLETLDKNMQQPTGGRGGGGGGYAMMMGAW